MAWLKKKREKAVINFIDIDKDLMSIRESVELSGKSDDPIEYDPTNDIKDLERKGYVLVKNNFNGDGNQPSYTEDTKVYLISFKHDVRPVNPDHPVTKIPSEEYDHPITFTVTFEGTPTKVKKKIQTAHLFPTLTADKVTSKRIENGKYDSDWQLDRQKFDDVKVPVLPGVHADQKIVVGPKVDKEDIEVSVTYHLNGYLIPVDEIPNVGPYQFATDEKDPTKIAPNQIVPDIEGYTHAQVQTFNQNHLVTQIFAVGLRHINLKEKNESSNSLQAFSQQQGEVLKKLENYQPTGNSKDLETITAVAKDTIEVLNKFLEKNQTVENTKNSATKKINSKLEDKQS